MNELVFKIKWFKNWIFGGVLFKINFLWLFMSICYNNWRKKKKDQRDNQLLVYKIEIGWSIVSNIKRGFTHTWSESMWWPTRLGASSASALWTDVCPSLFFVNVRFTHTQAVTFSSASTWCVQLLARPSLFVRLGGQIGGFPTDL